MNWETQIKSQIHQLEHFTFLKPYGGISCLPETLFDGFQGSEIVKCSAGVSCCCFF